ncbi:7 transmembrane receptor (rhodopsin family) domain-containing protein [Ditylenchus destructor]|uniref:7 transmembrane receptor (Rhodopsin family) domain-containing protein n=1 Tax=Ditylenchus destructor TaxID=166010 RepID=A0AAD4R956_9BILA|nr:7 transmembrane receptor (rhodopsin family) domain-containing protein [Ditylenchus destructor]
MRQKFWMDQNCNQVQDFYADDCEQPCTSSAVRRTAPIKCGGYFCVGFLWLPAVAQASSSQIEDSLVSLKEASSGNGPPIPPMPDIRITSDNLLLGTGGGVPPLCLGIQDIFIALFLIVLILMTVLGNVLVVLSVFLYKRMRTFTNFLLTSLATADLLVGLLIMPLSLIDLLHDHNWPFGPLLCSIWATSDVLLCTASILNLCIISLDRYMAITSPLKYPRTRSKLMACALLSLVWGISMIVCSPPWFIPEWNIFYNTPQQQWEISKAQFVCAYSPSVPYRIYSALVSFYIPLIVMLFVYFKIFRVASERERFMRQGLGTCRLSRRVEKTQRKGFKNNSLNNYHNRCASAPISRIREVQVQPQQYSAGNNINSLCYKEYSSGLPNIANNFHVNPGQTHRTYHATQRPPLCRSETDDVSADFETMSNKESFHSSETAPASAPKRGGLGRESKSLGNLHAQTLKDEPAKRSGSATTMDEQHAVGLDNSTTTQISKMTESNPNSTRATNAHHAGSTHRLQPANLLTKANGGGKTIRGSKEKIVYLRERKALKTIGIVVLGFIICWMPFFVVYLVEVFLINVTNLYSFKLLNEFFLWLGYSNSVLNPLIYTMYNGDFRRCFRDLLGLGCVQQHRRTMSVKKLHQQSTLF